MFDPRSDLLRCCPLFAIAVLITLVGWPVLHSQPLRLLSVGSDGVQAAGNSTKAQVSGNGRYVAFRASGLVPEDTVGSQIYLRDLVTNEIELISVTSLGGGAVGGADFPGWSNALTISDDGLRVLFKASDENLAPGKDLSGDSHLFLRDRATQTTLLITADDAGNPADGTVGNNWTLSPDGTRVMFDTNATNLGSLGATSFIREVDTGVTKDACFDENGVPLVQGCRRPSLSCNGLVAFVSSEGDIAPGDNTLENVYVALPLSPGDAEVLSTNVGGTQASIWGFQGDPMVDCGGRRVGFSTRDAVMVGDDDGAYDYYVVDTISGEKWKIEDYVPGATQLFGRLATNGSWVVLLTNDLLFPESTGFFNVYRLAFSGNLPSDLSYITQRDGVGANFPSLAPTISHDGVVAFESTASNLVALDANGVGSDVFVTGELIFSDGFESGDLSVW